MPQKRRLNKAQRKRLQNKKRRLNSEAPPVEEDVKIKVETPPNLEVEYVSEALGDIPEGLKEVFESFVAPEALFQKPSEDDEEGDRGDGSASNLENAKRVSKKKMKRLSRLSIAQLKQLVERPDLVQVWDATSRDPLLLLFLKSYRNAVPVPSHWSHKRKYLQGKRGIEKPPFELPDFVANTGIGKLRNALVDTEANKSVRQKAKERVQPKMGKIDIDYQILHDAFFRYQKKPKMSIHGDLYFEGKEFEVDMRTKKPGQLSKKLRHALGMPDNAPPPWLINMQRYGPPPSYPNLKIPGLNAPIPEGSTYGYQPGGWGKPPIDDTGGALYGDAFGQKQQQQAAPLPTLLWGELEVESESEDDMEESDSEENEAVGRRGALESGIATPMQSGIASVLPPEEEDTPDTMDLRKKRGGTDEQQPLYHVLEQQQVSVEKGAFFGSQHKYVVPKKPE